MLIKSAFIVTAVLLAHQASAFVPGKLNSVLNAPTTLSQTVVEASCFPPKSRNTETVVPAPLGTVSLKPTSHTLYYVDSIADIDKGKPSTQECVPAFTMTNDKGVRVTAMPRGATISEIAVGNTNFVWENLEGGCYYGSNTNSFPLTRGLILHGGIRFGAVAAEHGLYYDTDWPMTTDDSVKGSKSILFKIKDDKATRDCVKLKDDKVTCDSGGDGFSTGQFNRMDGYKPAEGEPTSMTKYPITDMEFTLNVTLKAGEDFVRLSMSIDNDTREHCNAEAWLPMTFPIDKTSVILSQQKTRWRRDEWWNGFLPNIIQWDCVNTYTDKPEDDFNSPLRWPRAGIFYDFPHKQGKYHGSTINVDGKGIVYYAPEDTPHYTKMWGWGNPDNFNRSWSVANDPLAAGRPYTEYYEPWSSGFNSAFFQTSEFKAKHNYNWEVALVPIDGGLDVGKTLEQKNAVVEKYLEEPARKAMLSSVKEATEGPIGRFNLYEAERVG